MFDRLRILLFSLVVLLIMLLPSTSARSAAPVVDPADAAAFAGELSAFAGFLAGLDTIPQLNQPIPMTDRGISDLMGLDAALNTLSAGLGSETDLAGVEAVLNTSPLVLPGSIAWPADADRILLDFTLNVDTTVTPEVAAALDIEGYAQLFQGGSFPVDLTLSAPIKLAYDPDVPLPERRFYLRELPAFNVNVGADDVSIDAFTNRFGFADTLVGGTVNLDYGYDLTFLDPDGLAPLTREEWTNTALFDLLEIEGLDDVNTQAFLANLTLTASQFGLNGTLTLQDPSLADGLELLPPDFSTLGELTNFMNVSGDDVLAGLAQFAAGLEGLQYAGDLKIPFVKGYLTDAFQVAEPFVNFVAAQGDADIVCGSEPGVPPLGPIRHLAVGESFYCQAYTAGEATNVQWNLESTGVTITGVTDDTAGVSPGSFVTVTIDDPNYRLKVNWEDGSGKTYSAVPRFETAGELLSHVQELAGIGATDALTVDIGYDPASDSLLLDVIYESDPVTETLPLDFGDKLEASTGLVGLRGTAGAGADVNPGNVAAHVSFGVALEDGLAMEDRFYLQNQSGQPLFQADVTAEANIDLEGQVGFLSVRAGGEPSANGGSAFALGAHDPAAPMLRVDLAASATYTEAGGSVPNAVAVKRLLADVPAYVEAECNVDMSAGLGVEAYLSGNPTPAASASFGVEWADVFEPASCVPNPNTISVTDDADFQASFAGFNPSGAIFGNHDGADSATELSDAGKDFQNVGRNLAGSLIYNQTDGSSCVIGSVSATTITCSEPLSGGDDDSWQAGDRYKIEGDPLALLGTILDSIELVAANIDDFTGGAASGALDEQLPILGVSGNDLLDNFKEIEGAIEDIRTATPDAVLYCGTEDGSPWPTGKVFTATAGTLVYCRAVTVGETNVSSVNWTMNNAVPAENTTNPATVGPAPSASAAFTLTAPGGYTEALGFGVQLAFGDDEGNHNATYPSTAQPQTLQVFEQKLESELGIAPERLTLEIADVGDDNVQDLVIRLDYGVCTNTPGGNQAINGCDPQDKMVPPVQIPMSLDMTDVPAMIGVEENQLYLEYAARANLHMALPLELTPSVQLLGSSKIELEAGAAGEELNLSASVGPISVLVGKAAAFTGTVSSTSVTTPTTWITDTTVAGTNAAGFDGIWVQPGDILYNEDRSEQCAIVTVDGTALECDAVISFSPGDTFVIGGNGYARLGTSFSVAYPGATPGDAYDVGSFVGGLDVTLAGIDKSCPDGSSAPACASLSMAFKVASADYYLGELGFLLNAGDLTDPEITPVAPLTRLDDLIQGEALDWALLWRALPGLVDYVGEGLDGAAQEVSVPVVGDALDGGANVAFELNDRVIEPLVAAVDLPGITSSPAALESGLENEINNLPDVNLSSVDVTVYCGNNPCGGAEPMGQVDDVRVEFTYVDQIVGAQPEFDLGVPGIPLEASGALSATVDLEVQVGFGLSREIGPYLVAYNDAEVAVTSRVGIGDNPHPDGCNQFYPYDPAQDPASLTDVDAQFSNERCLVGVLSFLQVTLHDGDDADSTGDIDNPTAVELAVGLDLAVEGGGDRIGLQQLTNKQVELGLVAEADVNVDLRVRTGLNSQNAGAFPSVLGTLHLGWGADITASTAGVTTNFDDTPEIAFQHLHLDVGEFVGDFLAPITKQINKITGPFMPVIDTLRAPLPVLSDLSKLTGGDDITLISLLEAASGADLTLVNRILDIVAFANEVSAMAAGYNGGPLWIPLGTDGGAFDISPDALTTTPNPGSGGDLIQTANSLSGSQIKQQLAQQANASGMTSSSDFNTEFTRGGLSFPFLDQPSQIFGLIMGQDATLMRYDFGTMRATAGVSYTFRFAIGPVPMSVTIAGSVTLEGRFAIGYDTYGIRQLVDSGNAGDLLDGLFIDDLDADGNDVPEVRLVGTVSARAAVDLVVVSAGVGGGIELTFELDLDDRPNPDGKLRMEEIVNKLDNPWCLFEVSGRLEAFFEAFVKVDFFLVSKTWTFELARATLLEFSAACEPPQPQLAHWSGNTLVLNIGPHADKRNILEGETAEEIVVREIMTQTRVSIAGFGYYQEFDVNASTLIWADGADDNDNISLEPGVTLEGHVVNFHLNAEIYGGSEDDRIRTGEGWDVLDGGSGNDEITAGGGNDKVTGGSGSDALDGGFGDDRLQGGSDNDRISGGPGSDRLYGDGGDDTLTGGPGEESGTSADGGDWLFGGSGADTITGGWGDDIAFGGSDSTFFTGLSFGDDLLPGLGSGAAPAFDVADKCDDAGSGDGNDIVNGDAGDDILFGDAGRDEMTGGGGDDLLCGHSGDDLLDGDDDDGTIADGNDVLYGGSDNDELLARGGSDDLWGGSGHDDLSGGDGPDRLHGEAGVDILVGDEGTIATHNDGSGNHLAHTTFGSDDLRALVTANENSSGDDTRDCHTADGDDRSDCLYGGADADYIWGEQGQDEVYGGGGGDFLYGNGDDDYMAGEDGADTMRGGRNDDEMHGGGDVDTMYGDSGADLMYGDEDGDVMRGGIGPDEMYGNGGADQMHGDGEDDYLEGNEAGDDVWGGAGADDIIGGSSSAGAPDADDDLYGEEGADVILGDNGTITAGGALPYGGPGRTITLYDLESADTTLFGGDRIWGNGENDALFGGGGDDTIQGNGGDDYAEGNGDSDTVYGDAGQDDLIGGSSVAGALDGADIVEGNGNQDVILGDNGTISRPGGSLVDGSVVRAVTLHDLDSADGDIFGGDTLDGNHGPDDIYGGGGVDTIHGNAGDDYVEGNNAGDTIYGDAGQDDLIGGTEQDGGGHLDGADTIYGGDGLGSFAGDDYDVILGDNGRITRTAGAGEWVKNSFNDSVMRTIRLFDVAEVGAPAIPAGNSGGDFLYGEADYDVMYGQGSDDTMEGNAGDDVMEGNAGDDVMEGNGGNDDMVGGTGPINDDPPEGVDGRYDGADLMHGNEGFDVMAGDNAVLRRTLDENGQWQSNSYNGGIQHDQRILRDLDSPDSVLVSGADQMWGDAQDDLMYGQGDNDEMHGGSGDDEMEGNAAHDTMNGNEDDDDMVGGTTAAGLGDGADLMHGNGGTDVLLGDNGTIARPLDGGGAWLVDANTGGEQRDVRLFEMLSSGDSVDATLFGGDTIYGDGESDQLFGQGGMDALDGGDDADYIEGNHGADEIYGGAGEDDIVGGGSSASGIISAYRLGGGSVDGASEADLRGDGLMDGGDTIYGDDGDEATGDEGDVIAGDNARITRTSDGNPLWQIDPNAGGNAIRTILLFDVIAYDESLPADVNGSDLIYGEGGRDLIFGQADDEDDDDGDGLFNEDPPDGVDNDRDGRELPGSYYDCEDGRDNDGDGWIDGADVNSSCNSQTDEDGIGDEIHGGPGDDYVEGNHGSDLIYGDAGQDDIVGGNSAGDGLIGGGALPYNLADGHDTIRGGAGDDNVNGDNAVVTRPVDAAGYWLRLAGYGWDMVVRDVLMADFPEEAGAYGHDYLLGNADNDDMYGQMGDDYMEGNSGEDAMVGDLGLITNSIEDGSREEIIETNAPFMQDTIYPEGSLYRQVELYSFERGDGAEGNDTMLGNDGNDSMHGAAGDDIMNGNADEDHLFGGDGDDVMWGGTAHDHLWGGHHDDYLDVFPREEWFNGNGKNNGGKGNYEPADPPEWFTYGPAGDNFEGYDVIYGGWDRDAMQANVGGPGPQDGDRLLDWVGAYNVYYVCPGAYGEGYITRMLAPNLFGYLETLAEADGALDTATAGSSGYRELGLVYHQDAKFNAHPPHPENPGHFTCTGGVSPAASHTATGNVSIMLPLTLSRIN